ncbi:calcium-activated chloride channel regulator 1 [Leptonychotes weddellii]|uniref:Calcium-activated chloride channel regulator 1 n=1 Tax=Leptonychotes weddellii TaxID=9713 RepID=A0A7F8QY36_LEPWE|nr:calcium-activated chloride channel regulator 1 [Leptonychotes weddellii]
MTLSERWWKPPPAYLCSPALGRLGERGTQEAVPQAKARKEAKGREVARRRIPRTACDCLFVVQERKSQSKSLDIPQETTPSVDQGPAAQHHLGAWVSRVRAEDRKKRSLAGLAPGLVAESKTEVGEGSRSDCDTPDMVREWVSDQNPVRTDDESGCQSSGQPGGLDSKTKDAKNSLKFVTLLVALIPEFLFLGAGVQLQDNGYDGLLVAINPQVSEDQNLIANIKEMITEASFYLFNATKRRVFFRNIKILIPATWKANNYSKVKQELYEKANVIVTDWYGVHGDDPYTLQYRGCGKEGKYIHFTSNFLVNDDLTAGYGPRGRVFVHEWAHLRWGVFDEYNDEKPFYINGQNQIKVTRCSSDITGIFVCEKGPCPQENCIISKLFKEGCMFIYNSTQNATASIMFMQSLSSVVEFCNARTHNQEAPNLQNQMCSLRSAWDVIADSADFNHSCPMNETEFPPPPMFSLIQAGDKVVCLVLDVSSKMAEADRLLRLQQAAEFYLMQIVEIHTFVGIISFNSKGEIRAQLHQINSDDDRKLLVSHLPMTVSAEAETSICSGLKKGFEVIRKKFSTDGSEIVLLTDGEDNTISSCFNEVKQSGAVIHTVALGPSAAKELEELSKMTGGLQTYASDQAQNNGLIDAFGALSSGNGAVSQRAIQLESRGLTLQNNQWMNGTVLVDSTVGNDTLFLITWTTQHPQILLHDPSGKKQDGFVVDTNTKMAYLQIPGTAKVGTWSYSLQASSQTLTLTVTSRASSATLPPITVTSKMNKDTGKFPSPMAVYAKIHQGSSPILRATVTAVIESVNGKTVTLELLDNGAGADATKDDGIYSRYFTAYDTNGRYSVKVWALGGINAAGQRVTPQQNGAMYMPGWIENGEIKWNPPRPEISKNDLQGNQVCFSRTSSGGSFVASGVPQAPIPDLFPPCQITDLKAKIHGDKFINLTWTAPGDDYDHGRAHKYIIRISTSILDLRDKFNESLQVNTSDLFPKEANSKEVFVFTPENIPFENGTDLFIAVQAVDKSNLKSEISNIVGVSLFIPPEAPPEIPTPSPPCPDINVNSTIPGLHILKIMWKWLGELQLSVALG